MGTIIKLIVLVLVIGVVAVVALAGIVAYGILNSEAVPISPEIKAEGVAVERKIEEALEDNSAFYLELTDDELSALLMSKLDEATGVRDAAVKIKPGFIDISGHLGGTPSVPFSGSAGVDFFAGEFDIDLQDVKVAIVPVPGAVKEELQPLIDQAIDINRSLSESGAAQIQKFEMLEGKMIIVGIQRDGEIVSDATKDAFLTAFEASGDKVNPDPPGADVVPQGSVAQKPGDDIYIALGDSLAANVGVEDPTLGYVSRFHGFMERETGKDLGLMNLGISGESSISIRNGQLQQALSEIVRRKDDGDPNTKVSVLTLDLGANDLLAHLGSTDCQRGPRGSACQARVDAAVEGFTANFEDIVNVLDEMLEDDAEFYIMTMYNPFDFGIGLPFEDFTNEIAGRMNDIIRQTAQEHGAKIADPFDSMGGKSAAWTNMLQGDIHPNGDGYQAMAFSFAEVR